MMMDPKYERLCDRIDAVNAEFRLRREIERATGKTPEMLRQYAARRPLPEHTRLLLEAWQDADEAMKIAIRLHEEQQEAERRRRHERQAQDRHAQERGQLQAQRTRQA